MPFLTLTAPMFDIRSRLMLIAPHPDDEALACSVILQKAVRGGAAIRVVYGPRCASSVSNLRTFSSLPYQTRV
ncbi:MAG: hypothetical protein DMF44_15435 [Verrucomicrobia bacterium]|nr:MAG: hypothetical protein DMF44_15435 [Verrucomicrobiota bacterium]